MVNIILKAFDGPPYKPMIRAAFQGISVDTCIFITNNEEPRPEMQAKRMVWMPAGPLRRGEYPDMDEHTTPLDEELIERMRHCEATFLTMMNRYERREDISYTERKRQYLAHLRYWNHTLDAEHIGLFLLNHIPHQCYDYVIYELCKLKKIPTYYLERSYIIDGVFLVKDIEESAIQIKSVLQRLQKEYADPSMPITLRPVNEAFFQAQTTRSDYAWLTAKPNTDTAKKNFMSKWRKRSLDLLRRDPRRFLKTLLSMDVWSRKFAQHRAAQFYEQHVEQPDLSAPYVYAPLQMQPEASTSPMGGVFVDQELMIQLLASCLPKEVRIYVKEHPVQGELCRSEAFYRSMQAIAGVIFVPRTYDTYALSKHAMAVATITGTAAFEGLFQGTPALLFGHRFFQYSPGVYPVRTVEDCCRAIQSIWNEKRVPTLRELRIFLKTAEECGVPYEGGPDRPDQLPREKRAEGVGDMIRGIIAPLFS